jgi:DNA-binding MarR family transcriptional regulator
MRLEEAIKQKSPFRNQWEKAAVNIIFTHNWMTNQQKQVFKKYGITLQQYNVLRILRGQHPKPISTSDIRNRMLDRMSDVSRIVDRLVKKDLVIRKICKSDKRLVDVVINDAGLELLSLIDSEEHLKFMARSLSEAEAEKLNELLDRLRD